MHKVLERQLKKVFGNLESVPKEIEALLKIIDETYTHYDEDRAFIERSIVLSSKELSDLNHKLQEESEALKQKTEETSRMNKLMIGRELKMIELKMEIAKLTGVLPRGVAAKAQGTESRSEPIIPVPPMSKT